MTRIRHCSPGMDRWLVAHPEPGALLRGVGGSVRGVRAAGGGALTPGVALRDQR